MRIVFSLLLGLIIAQSGYTQRIIDPTRCQKWGDDLTVPQAQSRMAWARRCDIVLQRIIALDPTLVPDSIFKNGVMRLTYPIYGTLDAKGKPTNPLGYFAPTIVSAPCNIPDGYRMVGLCLGVVTHPIR